MLSAQQQALTQQDEFAPLAAAAQNMKGKKLNKAIENYAWNIRMLKGQADLIAQAHQQCQNYLTQVGQWYLTQVGWQNIIQVSLQCLTQVGQQ